MKDQLLIAIEPAVDIRREPIHAASGYAHDDLQETQALYNEILLYRDEKDGWYAVEAMEQTKCIAGAWQGYPGWVRKDGVTVIGGSVEYDLVVKAGTARVLREPRPDSPVLLTVSIGTRFKNPSSHPPIVPSSHCPILPLSHPPIVPLPDSPIPRFTGVELADGTEGWVATDDLGVKKDKPEENHLRQRLVDTARLFLGVPYRWGGRSMPEQFGVPRTSFLRDRRSSPDKFPPGQAEFGDEAFSSYLIPKTSNLQGTARGVDCSGLTNLVFRANNIDIPRDAHDQWLSAERIQGETMGPGDLIFVSAEGEFDRITHVMLSTGGQSFMEASETGGVVQTNTFQEKFGADLTRLRTQDFLASRRRIYFGRVRGGNR
jgi:cell wall-associated NlpC family hydrolase